MYLKRKKLLNWLVMILLLLASCFFLTILHGLIHPPSTTKLQIRYRISKTSKSQSYSQGDTERRYSQNVIYYTTSALPKNLIFMDGYQLQRNSQRETWTTLSPTSNSTTKYDTSLVILKVRSGQKKTSN